MSTITLPNVRQVSDITLKVKLKDDGVAIDWSGLSGIKAFLYSDVQHAISGCCTVAVDEEDSTILLCEYSGEKPQFLGVNRVVVQARYMGRLKTYDKVALNIVPRTQDLSGETVTLDDPVVDVEISVEDVSSSILDNAIAAALAAAAHAEHAASLVPLQVLQDCEAATAVALIAASKAPVIGENGHWWVWNSQQAAYVDTGKQAKGDTGNGIASFSVVESEEDDADNVVTVTFTDGTTETFTVKNGKTGNGIASIVQTVESPDDAGTNVITVTMTNGAVITFNVKNGSKGTPGVANAKYKQVDTLPTAGAGTMAFIYLTPSGTSGVYNMSYTEQDGNSYTWKDLGTTAIQLSDYATKVEVSQLSQELYLGNRSYKKTLQVVQGTGIAFQVLIQQMVVNVGEYVYIYIENSQLINAVTIYKRGEGDESLGTISINKGFDAFKATDAIRQLKVYSAGSNIVGTGTLVFHFIVSKQCLSQEVEKALGKTSIQDAEQIRESILNDRGYYFDNTYVNAVSYEDTSYIDRVIASVPDGKHFLFSTDSHIDYSFQGYKSQKQTQIMNYVRKRLAIRNVIFGGDAVGGTENPNSKYKAARVLSLFNQEKMSAFGDGYLFVVGNHDVNRPMISNQGLSEETALISDIECYNKSVEQIGKHGKIVYDIEGIQCYKDRASLLGISTDSDGIENLVSWMKMHYYYDDVESKIRYIVLESGDGGKSILTTLGTNNTTVIWSQLHFLIKSLRSVPSGYDVVILQHEVYFSFSQGGYVSETFSYINTFFAILSAYKNKTSFSFQSTGQNVGEPQKAFNEQINDNENTVVADFTDSTASGRLFILCGHEHFDDAWIITNSGGTYSGGEYALGLATDNSSLLIITTDRSCITKESASTAFKNRDDRFPNAASVYMEQSERLGTINECLFDIVTITNDNRVVCTRVGASGEHINGNPPTPVREFYLP